MGLNNNIKKQILVPKRPHDAYNINVKRKFSVGKCCHKGKEIGVTYSPQDHNAFWGDRDSEGIKEVMRRTGYDLKATEGLEELHIKWKDSAREITTSVGDTNTSG